MSIFGSDRFLHMGFYIDMLHGGTILWGKCNLPAFPKREKKPDI
jgi:hypothetical protein